jgi:glycosyltransferase involved in cell wall biosynthesis
MHVAPANHSRPSSAGRFLVACFARSGDDNFARALDKNGLLDFFALGTRRGTKGVSPEHTRLQPVFGLLNYIFAQTLPAYQAESLRFRLFPLFDRWAQSLLKPGQHFFTGFAFANGAMRRAKQQGGVALINAWTSHPNEFWSLLTEEQQRWGSRYLPVSRFYQDLTVESVVEASYVFTTSNFIRNSFLKHGFDPHRLLFCPLPVDLELFQSPAEPRPASRPFTILHTGGLSLRKGAPYLLEAFRLIRKEVPNAVLRVKRDVRNEAAPIVRQYRDLPLEWLGYAPPAEHCRRYRTSDLFLFPSIEDGYANAVAEALACGLPVVTTPNAGSSDFIQPGKNGEIVPIRDAPALAQAALKWWERIRAGERVEGIGELRERLSFGKFEATFIGHLVRLGILAR